MKYLLAGALAASLIGGVAVAQEATSVTTTKMQNPDGDTTVTHNVRRDTPYGAERDTKTIVRHDGDGDSSRVTRTTTSAPPMMEDRTVTHTTTTQTPD